MKVTYHATKRFLQRVLKKDRWTMQEFHVVKQHLEKMFISVVPEVMPDLLPCRSTKDMWSLIRIIRSSPFWKKTSSSEKRADAIKSIAHKTQGEKR